MFDAVPTSSCKSFEASLRGAVALRFSMLILLGPKLSRSRTMASFLVPLQSVFVLLVSEALVMEYCPNGDLQAEDTGTLKAVTKLNPI